MILVLDNRDSFTFNVVELLEGLGAEVRVERSSRIGWRRVAALGPAGIVVGPGPGTPAGAGCSEDVIRHLSARVPTLGLCLGLQAIATALGGRVVRAAELVHGQLRPVHHDGRGLFRGLPSPLELTRYNSLAVEEASLAPELVVSAREASGEIAGLRHRTWPLEGVQGHPESIMCVDRGGRELLATFVRDTVHTVPGTFSPTSPS